MNIELNVSEEELKIIVNAMKSCHMRNYQTKRLHSIEIFPGIEKVYEKLQRIEDTIPVSKEIEEESTYEGPYSRSKGWKHGRVQGKLEDENVQ